VSCQEQRVQTVVKLYNATGDAIFSPPSILTVKAILYAAKILKQPVKTRLFYPKNKLIKYKSRNSGIK